MECSICKTRSLGRKQRIQLFGKSERAETIKKSILLYFKEEVGKDVGDLKEVLSIDSYVCFDCAKLIDEYPKIKERWKYVESTLMMNLMPIASGERVRSPARTRPPIPLAMSTSKSPRLTSAGIPESPPVQVIRHAAHACMQGI